MNPYLRVLCLAVLQFIPTLLFAQTEQFDILIHRTKVQSGLVYGIIYLNGKPIGESFENDQLKITAGKYKGLMRYNSGRNFAQNELGRLSKQGDFLLEVSGVPGRTAILLHQGNRPQHSKGCILLGPATKGPDGAVLIDKDHPLFKLRLAFYGTEFPVSCPDKDITITVSSM